MDSNDPRLHVFETPQNPQVGFSEAFEFLCQDYAMRRDYWPEGQFVVRQKGYPLGIPCNKQTADIWGMEEGDIFKCGPYLQMQLPNGSHVMWEPNTDDLFATDWRKIF